jgi:hypothetical protein
MKFDVTYRTEFGIRTLLGLNGQQASWVQAGLGARLIEIKPRRIDARP